MKKLLGIVVLGLLLTINPAYSKVGKGNLTFSPEVLENFLKYLRNELATSFVVTKDGKFALYGLCRDKSRGCQGGPGNTATLMKNCKKEYGEKCFIFAQRKNFKSDPSSSYINISKKIRWNNVDYEFPKEKTWKGMGYGESKGEGIKKDVSDDQIKSVLNELGFISFNKAVASIASDSSKMKTKKIQKGGEYFCVWTGTGEYADKLWFSHSSDVIKWKELYGGKGNDDCRNSALYIIYKEENKKLHSKLLWKYKTYESGFYPAYKLSKKLFAEVKEQVPVNVIELKEEVEQSIVTNETSVVPKVEKKMTKQQQIEIDQIKEMFDIGALTKEEYDNAIRRVLN